MTANTITNKNVNLIENTNGVMDDGRQNGDMSPDDSQNSKSLSDSPIDTPNSDDLSGRLNTLINEYGYQIFRENGQRKFCAPAEFDLPSPPRGCEVFVGKLPRDVFEDELVPLFEKCGQIYELRLMMDFSGTNRGYAFVTYTDRESAKTACVELNNYEIRRGRHIGVVLSVDNCRLFVGGIPRNRTREEVKAEMSKLTDGVMDVILYPSAADKTKNRGFAFVEYESHKAAAKARRKLIPNRIQLWGSVIAVDWAEPEQDVDENTMANVKVLYVRNLMVSTTEDAIRKAFEKAAGVSGSIERVKKMRDYAFVHFTSREFALKARDQLNGGDLEGAIIEVVLSKPPYQSNIVRCMKTLQKSSNGSRTTPQSANNSMNEELMTAAVRQMYAGPTLANNLLTANGTPMISPMPSPWFVVDPTPIQTPIHPMINVSQTASALTGFPCIDPYANGVPNGMNKHDGQIGKILSPDIMNGQANGIPQPLAGGRVNRGAAGMRSAGFQAMINNTLRQSAAIRRKVSEQFIYDCLSPQQQPPSMQQQSMGIPQQPLLSPQAGVVLIPNGPGMPPFWRAPLTSPTAAGYVPFIQTAPMAIPVPQSAPASVPMVSESISTAITNAQISAPATVTSAVASNDESSINQQAMPMNSALATGTQYLMNGNVGGVSFINFQQLLEEFCREQGFGAAQYERSTLQQKDTAGRDVVLYNYKITIPALSPTYGSFQLPKFWSTEMEAREAAAQFVFQFVYAASII